MSETPVLCKQNEQIIPAPVHLDFRFKGTTYHTGMLLDITPALASIPCAKCGKTTRQIQLSHGVILPEDDQQVNILDEIFCESLDHARSEEVSEYVSVISALKIRDIEDIDSMIKITEADDVWAEIDAHAKSVLLRQTVCDTCLGFSNYMGNLLEN